MKVFLTFFTVCLLWVATACADSFIGDVFGQSIDVDSDVVVYENIYFKPSYVNVSRTVDFINNGNVDTEFRLCAGCNLYVRNRGDFTASFLLGADAEVIQVVSNVGEFNPIFSDTEYTLMFDGFDGSSLDGDLTGNVVLKNSVMELDALSYSESVELIGDNVLVVDDASGLNGCMLLGNVSGDGRVRIEANSTDRLYAYVGFIDEGKLFVRYQRETDYEKVFKNDVGAFLNNLRRQNPDDGLLYAMDATADMTELKQVMGKSVRLNPDVLRDVGQVMRLFYRNSWDWTYGFRTTADFIYSDDFYFYGVGGRVNAYLFGVDLSVAVHGGKIEYKSDFDEFDGRYYGINLGAKYQMVNNLFLRGMLDFSRIDVNVGDVFYDDKVIDNPSVLYFGGGFDFGYKYGLGDSFYLSPYAGVDITSDGVEHCAGVDYAVRVGGDMEYSYEVLGIKYNYALGAIANTDNKIMATARVGFWSDYDGAGADINLATLRLNDVWSYQVSIGARISF